MSRLGAGSHPIAWPRTAMSKPENGLAPQSRRLVQDFRGWMCPCWRPSYAVGQRRALLACMAQQGKGAGAPGSGPKAVGMGSCGLDYLAQVAAFPRPDDKLRTENLEVRRGSCPCPEHHGPARHPWPLPFMHADARRGQCSKRADGCVAPGAGGGAAVQDRRRWHRRRHPGRAAARRRVHRPRRARRRAALTLHLHHCRPHR